MTVAANTPLVLSGRTLRFGECEVDVGQDRATAILRNMFGPTVASHRFLELGRSADVLRAGIIVLVEDDGDDLLSFMVCFHPNDGSIYKAFDQVPVFPGKVECAGYRFAAGDLESRVHQLPGITGFPGALMLVDEPLHLGLHFKKPRNTIGKRTGSRRLVRVVAEWGRPRGFRSNWKESRSGGN